MTIYFNNNWRLSKTRFTKSYFKLNRKYNEHTPIELVQAFIANKQGVSLKNNRVLKTKYDNEEQQMGEYLKNYDKFAKVFKVKYVIPAHKWGRINPDKSLALCVFHRPTRHAYCKGVYIDIDMKNAHPVIIKNICKLNGVACPTIEKYCDDRDAFLKGVAEHHRVSKEEAKRLILRLTYGGEYGDWLGNIQIQHQSFITAMPEVKDYELEMAEIRDIVFQHNSHIISDVEEADPSYFKKPKYKTPEDVLRKKKKTCMSHFCCTIERHLQEACVKHLVENKGFKIENDIVPSQDGFMILQELYYDGILNECEEAMFNTLGLELELKVKEFDEACDIPVNTSHTVCEEKDEVIEETTFTPKYLELLEEPIRNFIQCIKNANSYAESKSIRGECDYDYALLLHHYYKDRFVCTNVNENKWYEFKNHRWNYVEGGKIELRTMISTELRGKFSKAIEFANDELDEVEDVESVRYKYLKRDIRYLYNSAEKLGITSNKQNIMIECKDLFYVPKFEDNLDANTKLVCFTNGVFDFSTLLFRDGTPTDMCSMCTNIPMIPLTPEEILYMEDVNQRIFYNPLGKNVGDYFKLIIAKALAGDKQKIISYCIGISNSGKSTITVVCSSSFGDYVGSFNAESLALKKTGQDEGQLMRWLLLLQKKRLIFSNEGSGGQDGNIIKKITGGDPLVARLHCKNEQTFYFNGLPVSFANDFPKIKPYDKAVANRIRVIPFDLEFVDEPTNQFQLKKINEDILKEEMNSELFKRVFMGLIIRAYIEYIDGGKVLNEPCEVVRAIEEWTEGEGNNFIPKFLVDYEITNNVKDYVVSKDMQTWNDRINPGISFVAFSKELKKHCIIQNYDNVYNKAKKVNGKSLMCWFGVRPIQYIPELELEEGDNIEYILEEM